MDYNSHEEHLHALLDRWDERVATKYTAGQEEHGGMLWRKPLIAQIQDEIADLMVYFDTHKEQQKEVQIEVGMALYHAEYGSESYKHLIKAANLIAYGNAEGKEEEERNASAS